MLAKAAGASFTPVGASAGTNGYLLTPDSVANSPSNQLEIVFRISVPYRHINPTEHSLLLVKNETQPFPEYDFRLSWLATNPSASFFPGPTLYYWDAGWAGGTVVSVDNLGTDFEFPINTPFWMKITWNGSTKVGAIYFSDANSTTPPSSWTTIVNQSHVGPTGNFVNSTADVRLLYSPLMLEPFPGKLYYLTLARTIGGAPEVRFDASDGTIPTFNNMPGETAWTAYGDLTVN